MKKTDKVTRVNFFVTHRQKLPAYIEGGQEKVVVGPAIIIFCQGEGLLCFTDKNYTVSGTATFVIRPGQRAVIKATKQDIPGMWVQELSFVILRGEPAK